MEQGSPVRPTPIFRRIEALREMRGLTKRGLARAANLAPSTVIEVELGYHIPKDTTLQAIASALDIPVAWLTNYTVPVRLTPQDWHDKWEMQKLLRQLEKDEQK